MAEPQVARYYHRGEIVDSALARGTCSMMSAAAFIDARGKWGLCERF